jgi:lipopolysaccharide biosynthesis protein
MTNSGQENRADYKYYDFQKLWKYFPVRRSFKEMMKNILFALFPFVFSNWAIYQNWKYAKAYRGSISKPWQTAYWQRMLNNQYTIPIPGQGEKKDTPPPKKSLAVVIHVFYPEIFREIIMHLTQQIKVDTSLYLTGPGHILEEVKVLIPEVFKVVNYLPVKNHGRDILPFLQILPQVFNDGHEQVLKLHTKYSNHLNRREHWRSDLLSKLIGDGMINHGLEIFEKNPFVGMIGPYGNILPMQLYYAANGERVQRLSHRMGLSDKQLRDLNFVAGSMFYATKTALMPILQLDLRESDFEPEAGQKDGTMAHVVERLFSAALITANLHLADTNYDFENPVVTVSKVNHFIV